ncbi:MAG: hypothetical protein ABIF77_05520 [bacterium]
MKTRAAFSLTLSDEQTQIVKLVPGEGSPYRIEWIETMPAGEPLSARCQREMSRRGSRLFQVIPGGDVYLLITKLPRMKRKQTLSALGGVAVREKGQQPADWVIDYNDLPERPGPGGTVVGKDLAMAFTERKTVDRLYQAAVVRGLFPDGFVPGYLALDALFRRHLPETARGGAWNLVHLGFRERVLIVGDENGPLFSRPLPEDLSGGTETEEYLNRLQTEIERSNYFAQQAERSLLVQNIVVSGESILADSLAETIEESSELKVLRWQADDLFSWQGAEPGKIGTIPLAAAALAFTGADYDLRPQAARQRAGKATQRYAALAASTSGLALAPILLAGGLWTTNVQQQFLTTAQDRLDETRPRVEEAVMSYMHHLSLTDRQGNLDRLDAGRPDLATLLRDVTARTPRAITYTDLNLVQKKESEEFQLILSGQSTGADGVVAQQAFLILLESLAECPQLREVREPTHMEITGDEEDGPQQTRVVFTLEYQITEDSPE